MAWATALEFSHLEENHLATMKPLELVNVLHWLAQQAFEGKGSEKIGSNGGKKLDCELRQSCQTSCLSLWIFSKQNSAQNSWGTWASL